MTKIIDVYDPTHRKIEVSDEFANKLFKIGSSVTYDCPSESPEMGYVCTRDAGHYGAHLASDGFEIVAAWPSEKKAQNEN